MAGKAGRSGRKPGALSWHQNAAARAGHRLNVLIEMWLACAPEPRSTVPPKIMRDLALQAIREELDLINLGEDVLTIDEVVRLLLLDDDDPELRRTPGVVVVDVDAVLAGSRRQAPKGPSLRRKVRQRLDSDDHYAQYLVRISNAWRSPQGC